MTCNALALLSIWVFLIAAYFDLQVCGRRFCHISTDPWFRRPQAECHRQLRPQNSAAEEAAGLAASVTGVCLQPRVHALLRSQPQHDCPGCPVPPGTTPAMLYMPAYAKHPKLIQMASQCHQLAAGVAERLREEQCLLSREGHCNLEILAGARGPDTSRIEQ